MLSSNQCPCPASTRVLNGFKPQMGIYSGEPFCPKKSSLLSRDRPDLAAVEKSPALKAATE
jgi:hypothetical protein